MKLTIRTITSVALAGVLSVAAAQDFPSEPIEVITHASAGGGTDTTARMMVSGAKESLPDTFVTIKTGGGGAVAMSYFMKKAADGHAVLAITPTHLFTMARGKAPMKIDDVRGVVRATDDPIIIMVKGDSEIETVEQLIERSNENPIKWGGTQIGGVDHIAAMSFAAAAGTKIAYVPFDGGGEFMLNLMGGNIEAAGLNITEAKDQVESGDLRALAVMAAERIPFLPDVPTLKEKGMDVEFSTVRGYLVKADTPDDVVAQLEAAFLESLNAEEYQKYLTGNGLDASSVAGAEVWDAQMRRLYGSAEVTMRELGLIQ